MKTETKVFIVLIILLASLGPISFFFDTGQPQQIELDEDQDQSLFINLNGNVTGQVMEFQPYISYVGISSQNNEEYVTAVIDSIDYNENYTLDVMLNPSGNGYLYKILVPLNSTDDAPYVGFRLAYRLESFFTGSDSYPVTLGKVLLPGTFMIEDQVIRTENQSVISSLLYSKRVNSTTTIFCFDYSVVRTGGALTSVYEPCTDLTRGDENYGLSMEDVLLVQPISIQLELNVTDQMVSMATYNYEYGADATGAKAAFEALGYEVLNNEATNVTVGLFAVRTNSIEADPLNEIKSEAAKYDYLILEEEFKMGTVLIPQIIEINGTKYEPFMQRTVNSDIDMDVVPGPHQFKLDILTLYGEISDIKLEMV